MKAKTTILVVDDEENLCQTVAGELRREQYAVSEAYDGETAIACINEHLQLSFEVVILDIAMPGIDGFQVLDHIKKHNPSTRVIMVTGHADFKSAIEAMKRGADEFITKPYELDILFDAIQKVLAGEGRLIMKGKKQILIVDDEEEIRTMLSKMLTSEGYEVETFGDRTKVVDAIKSHKFDLLILDIQLKNQPIDGFDVLREMKKQKIKQTTLMISGFDDLKNAIEASKLGAIGFISKPFRFHEVLSEVEKSILK